MNQGKLIFAQITEHMPLSTFRRCVARYDGEHKVKRFSCLDQYLCMAFAQLTWRESLRDIEACPRVHKTKLYHLGIRGNVARNTLANANATRDWRIYCDFAQRLIGIARRLYAEEPLGIELKDNGLRTRLNHNRPVSFGVFLGTLPIDESRCEAPHATRSTWQYSVIYLHQRRQVSRR